jgi:hypothetical protein
MKTKLLAVLVAVSSIITFLPIIPSDSLPEDWRFKEVLNYSGPVFDVELMHLQFKIDRPSIVYGNIAIDGDPLNVYVVDELTSAMIAGEPSANKTLVLESNSFVVIRGDEPKLHHITSHGEFNIRFVAPKAGVYGLIVIPGDNRSNLTIQLYRKCLLDEFISLYDALRLR